MTPIEKAWRDAFAPPDRRPIYEALADDIVFGNESPYPGPFDIANSPWIKERADKLFDYGVGYEYFSSIESSERAGLVLGI